MTKQTFGPYLLFAAAMMSCANHAHAQEQRETPDLASEIAEALPDSGEIHLGMYTAGKRDGHMRLGWRRSDDGILIYDRTMLPSAEVFETMRVELTPTLEMSTVSVVFHQGTAVMSVELKAAENKISGKRSVQTLEGKSDTDVTVDLKPGTLARPLTFIWPSVIDRKAGDEVRYQWYGLLQNQKADITVSVTDGGTVETPAGSFETLRYEVRGGAPDNDIFVSRGADRRIVRIDVLGSPIQFLALPSPVSDTDQSGRSSEESP